jgi:glycosyltransferase involved in cell wall biosynthesis
MGYSPNIDAMLYFCDEILPLIQAQVPNVKLVIAGQHPAPAILKLAERAGVSVTGAVPEVTPYYQQARLSIVPLRAGGGTRLKILESMALGRPVVSTSLGCEGLQVVDQEHLLIADTPVEFAQRVIQLLQDRELRARLAGQARRLVESRYDWSVISANLLRVYHDLVVQVDGISR